MTGGRPLRVVLTCPYSLSLYGGVQVQVLGLAQALRARGVDARVVAPTDGPPPLPGVTSVGPSIRFPSNGSIAPINSTKAAVQRTLEALRVFEPDVLHLHEPLQPGVNHAALLATDIPAVGTFHASHPGRNGWYEALRLPLRKMVDRLAVRTAVSEEAQRNVETTFGGSCEILPNGVDVAAFAAADPWPSDRPTICFVGRHERRKGLGVLLDAFAMLDQSATLWVVGDGPETPTLRARGIEGVTWLGTVSEAEKAARLPRRHAGLLPVHRRGVVRDRAPRGDGRRRPARGLGPHRLPPRRPRRARSGPGAPRRPGRARGQPPGAPRRRRPTRRPPGRRPRPSRGVLAAPTSPSGSSSATSSPSPAGQPRRCRSDRHGAAHPAAVTRPASRPTAASPDHGIAGGLLRCGPS